MGKLLAELGRYRHTGKLPADMYHVFSEVEQSLSMTGYTYAVGRLVGMFAGLFALESIVIEKIWKWLELQIRKSGLCLYVLFPALLLTGKRRRDQLIGFIQTRDYRSANTINKMAQQLSAYHPFLLPFRIEEQKPNPHPLFLPAQASLDKWTLEVLIGYYVFTGDDQGICNVRNTVRNAFFEARRVTGSTLRANRQSVAHAKHFTYRLEQLGETEKKPAFLPRLDGVEREMLELFQRDPTNEDAQKFNQLKEDLVRQKEIIKRGVFANGGTERREAYKKYRTLNMEYHAWIKARSKSVEAK